LWCAPGFFDKYPFLRSVPTVARGSDVAVLICYDDAADEYVAFAPEMQEVEVRAASRESVERLMREHLYDRSRLGTLKLTRRVIDFVPLPVRGASTTM
jgi:hypothetical protein